MPRSEPVPTAPAPPIWNVERGSRPSARAAASVTRSPGRAGSCGGRGRGPRPQNGGRQAASHSSPSRATRSHRAATSAHPCSRANQPGRPKEKSRPATRGPRRRGEEVARRRPRGPGPPGPRASRPGAALATRMRRWAARASPTSPPRGPPRLHPSCPTSSAPPTRHRRTSPAPSWTTTTGRRAEPAVAGPGRSADEDPARLGRGDRRDAHPHRRADAGPGVDVDVALRAERGAQAAARPRRCRRGAGRPGTRRAWPRAPCRRRRRTR